MNHFGDFRFNWFLTSKYTKYQNNNCPFCIGTTHTISGRHKQLCYILCIHTTIIIIFNIQQNTHLKLST